MKKTDIFVSLRDGVLRLKQYSRQLSQSLTASLLLLALLPTAPATGQSNCQMSCHGAQISLDENCEAVVTVPMIADVSLCQGGQFTVYVYTLQGDTLPNATVNANHRGMTLIASVYDNISGNSCWSYITVQDKLPPQMDCECSPVTGLSGVITASDPATSITAPCWDYETYGSEPLPGLHYYHEWHFVISEAGMYHFIMPTSTMLDPIASIFANAFDPASPCLNWLGGDDDSNGPQTNPAIQIDLMMVPGHYVLVTSSWNPGITGAYNWLISGPGDVFNFGEDCFKSCNEIGPNWPAPQVVENCPGPVTTILLDEQVEALCDSFFIKKITRQWTAQDASGNRADTCTQVFYLERINLDAVVFPIPRTVADGNALKCYPKDWADADNDGIPDPLNDTISTNPLVVQYGTGVPTINGNAIFPDFMGYCNALTTYEDYVFPQIGCVKKIMRTWTVREWHCMGERQRVFVQLIEVVDDQGPALVCPANFSHSTNSHDCNATVWVPAPAATDACGTVSRITANIPGGFVEVTGAGFWATLPAGNNLITFTAYDQCYNSNTCTMTVSILDETPPVPVCDAHTVVSLTLGGLHGLTKVDASVFDDGSYDGCGPVTFLAYRMTSCIDFDWTTGGAGVDETPNGIINSRDLGTDPRPKVPFACCDAGAGPIMVVLVVTDASGNSNTCMVEVTVQDKIRPQIACPSNVTISCDYPVNIDDMSEFGTVVSDIHDIGTWCVDDSSNPNAVNGHICGQDGLVTDNCDVTITVRTEDHRNNCGEGYIDRIWTAADANGAATCVQRITVINFDPVSTENIVWPYDYHGQECSLGTDPEDLPPGYQSPYIDEDACDLVGVTYEDVVFPIVDGACWKILRTWKIIDWCRYEVYGLQPGVSYWEHTQVIKVTNANGPEFVTEQPTIELCNTETCDAMYVELIQRATDDCTPGNLLQWTYAIDINNDGWIELGPYTGLGDIINASGYYDLGNYRIIYSFEDRCGNRTVREQLFNIESCKAPVPVCINGLSADLMPIGNGEGMVRIWATDFDASSYHPCNRPFTLSFSSDPTDIYRDFTCEHVGQGQVYVEIWATDQLGNQTYCETYIIITDNLGACPGNGNPQGIVTGNVSTETSDNVLDVEVELGGSSLQAAHTDQSGTFAFPAMPVGGSYTVVPGKNNDFKNGVSTLDLLQIQKHLLGIQYLDSPYKLIAADANNSQSITAIDLIELRKLVLGLYDELPNNSSWRFVDKAYVFPDPSNPWMQAWPENRALNPLVQGMNHVDFRAIKVGDVNNTVKANAQSVTPRGSGEVLDLVIDEQAVSAGETIEVPVYPGAARSLEGMQLTFRIGHGLEWTDVLAGQFDMTTENFGWLNGNTLTTSWNNVNPVDADPTQPLFTLVFKATGSSLLSQAIAMGTLPTEPEAYVNGEILDLAITFRGADDSFVFELMQNEPNPFNGATRIGFMLPATGEATLTLFDLAGRQLLTRSLDGVKGMNTVELTRDQINATGVVYYQVQFQGYTATKKMLIL